MEGCPYCDMIKEQLTELDIHFEVRDINEHEDEYQMFVEITENEFVPAFMIVESPDTDDHKSYLYAPDRDYDEIEEGVAIIKEHFGK
jgi:glutaredoxin-related protein